MRREQTYQDQTPAPRRFAIRPRFAPLIRGLVVLACPATVAAAQVVGANTQPQPQPQQQQQTAPEPADADAVANLIELLQDRGEGFSARADQPESDPEGQPADTDAQAPDRLENGSLDVDAFERIDLHVVAEDLSTVLRLLSIETKRNIVMVPDIEATVTADFYKVGFYEALEAMLEVNGLGYEERGSFIYVYTQEQLEAMRADEGPLRAEVIDLNYLNATDAAALVEPLLSEAGSITQPGPSEDFTLPDESPAGRDLYASGAVIVVHDTAQRIERVRELLARLDVQPRQVLIEATILQASVDEDNAWGVDFSILANLEFSELASPLEAVASVADGSVNGQGTAASSAVGSTSTPGGIRLGVLSDSIAVFVRALDEVTDVTTISRPKLLTLNRQAARVLVGTRFGFLNSTTTNDNTTVQEVDFLNTGTQLRVRPFIMQSGEIRLELRPQVSSATTRSVSAPGGGTLTIPDEDTTELVTNLIVRDGQTIVLGGLFTESTERTRRQAPGLGDLPLIGAAFRGRDDSVSRSEIIFLIRPTILDQPAAALRGIKGDRAVANARIGSRRGLLPWSRDRRLGQLLIDARRLRDQGRTDDALLNIERALQLAPSSLEAARMRDELITDRLEWPGRGVLESIMRGEP